VTVFYNLPEYFLSPDRLSKGSGGSIDENHSKTSAFNKAIDNFRETFDFEDPILEFKFKLPFKVDNNFFVRLRGTSMTKRTSVMRTNSTICYT
jgi:hypothetical protein